MPKELSRKSYHHTSKYHSIYISARPKLAPIKTAFAILCTPQSCFFHHSVLKYFWRPTYHRCFIRARRRKTFGFATSCCTEEGMKNDKKTDNHCSHRRFVHGFDLYKRPIFVRSDTIKTQRSLMYSPIIFPDNGLRTHLRVFNLKSYRLFHGT